MIADFTKIDSLKINNDNLIITFERNTDLSIMNMMPIWNIYVTKDNMYCYLTFTETLLMCVNQSYLMDIIKKESNAAFKRLLMQKDIDEAQLCL